MALEQILLATLLLIFYAIGGMIDTYTSYRFFPPKKEPPKILSNFTLVWWCLIYSGLLPALMVFVAGGFQFWVAKVWIVFGILGSVAWDLMFSKIWSGKWISESCITWGWVKLGEKRINIGFSEDTVVWLHISRVIGAVILFLILF